MSIIKKIKEFFRDAPAEQETKETSIIKLEELPNRIELLSKENALKNLKLKTKIEERSSQFSRYTKELIKILKEIDLAKRKEVESIKSRVLQNLEIYLVCLNNLVKELDNLKEQNPTTYFNKIILMLNHFYKSSYKPYERATYLIGKELASTKDSIKKFTQDIHNLSEENKDLFEENKKIENISNLFKELKKSEKLEKEFQTEINNFDLKISNINEECFRIEKTIKALEENKDYKNDLERKKDYLNKQAEIDKELEKAKREIDYKLLANIFHNDNKKLKIIKDYSENFKSMLMAEEEPRIIEFAKEAQNIDISYIKELRQKFVNLPAPILKTESEILSLNNRLNDLRYEKTNTNSEINEENKRLDKLSKKKEEIISSLRKILIDLGIILE